jgi:hypothetical protein
MKLGMTHILLLQRMTKWSHAYYHDGLAVCCPQPARILLPASLKMRMLLFRMWQVNTHNPRSGHCHPYPRRRVVHTFTGVPTGKSNEARHITRDSSPLCVLLLFFAQISTLFVVETNRYYQDSFDSITDMKSSPKPDVTEAEMFVFLTPPLGRLEQLRVPFYSKMMKRDRYLHSHRFYILQTTRKEWTGQQKKQSCPATGLNRPMGIR